MNRLKWITLSTLATLLILPAAQAMAYARDASLNVGGWYYSGQEADHYFNGSVYVDRLVINARGNDDDNDGNIDVYVNGEWVTRLAVPSVDPEYIVDLDRYVSSVRLVFSNGAVYVSSAEAYVEDPHYHYYRPVSFNNVTAMANRVLDIVAQLQRSASDSEFETYLKPLRRAAVLLAATSAGWPIRSVHTASRAAAMVKAIDKAAPYVDRLEDDEMYTNAAKDLMTIREELVSAYR